MRADDRTEQLARLDENWQELQAQLALLVEDEVLHQHVIGDWSARALMTHIAYHDTIAITALEDMLRSRSTQFACDPQLANKHANDDAAVLSLEAVRRQMRETHASLLRALREHPGISAVRDLDALTTKHYRAYAEAIRGAIEEASR
ncbi:MAG TPA: DinB family protein [Thermomicrobiaceae bacterium]|nr:DinB family protein [Thermomicrobiaceae bacterium]